MAVDVGGLGDKSHVLCGGDKSRALPDRREEDFGKTFCLVVEDLGGAMPRPPEDEKAVPQLSACCTGWGHDRGFVCYCW